MTYPKQSSDKSDEQKGQMSTFRILQATLGVAFVVATIFTMWTPNQSSQLESGALNLLRLPTINPATTPTRVVDIRKRIGIVAGHWGHDSGAVCPDGLKEVDVNITIASLVRETLVKMGYQVDLLEEFDIRLSNYQAAALVSIHADSCEFINAQATGFKVAAAFATLVPEESSRLTACIRHRYQTKTGLPVHSTSITPDMSSYHAFEEINDETPAAIIETGFMNLDRQLLVESPQLVAQGIVDGILCYLRNESIPYITAVPSPTINP